VLVDIISGSNHFSRTLRRFTIKSVVGELEMTLKEIGIDGVNWIRLAQDRVRWRAFVNTVMNLRAP